MDQGQSSPVSGQSWDGAAGSVPVVGKVSAPRRAASRFRPGTVVTSTLLLLAVGLALDLERNRSMTHFNTPPSFEFSQSSKSVEPSIEARQGVDQLMEEAARHHKGEGVAQNHQVALDLYRQAAGLGSGAAMNTIGLMFAEGDGVAKDGSQAKAWFEKAAEAGESDGLANLGWMYQEAVGVAQDYRLAHSWFQKAADRGNAEAMNRLGLLHVDGLGTEKNPQEALRWFKMAADRGNSGATNNLGWLYRDGIGVEQDFVKARALYQKAAKMGNEVSAWSLSTMLDEGKGGPVAPADSAAYLLQAAKGGHKHAVDELNGTMQNWNEATRFEVKRALAASGHFKGKVDGNWDEAAKAAARHVMPAN
jgi:TPR repeat protein